VPIDVAPLFSDEPKSPSVPVLQTQDPGVSLPLATVTRASVPADLPNDDDVTNLGHEIRDDYAKITDALLSQHKAADLGEMSSQLTKLVGVSRGFNPADAKGGGLVGRALHMFRSERDQLLAHMQSVKTQVDGIVADIDKKAALQRQRIHDLGDLAQSNLTYHEGLKAAVERGQAWLAELSAALAAPLDQTDPLVVAKVSALQRCSQRLQVKINDFQNGMTLAKQQAIEIQSTTDNARTILEEFDRAKTTVIPALESLLANQLIAIEQRQAVATDNMLRETLDAAIRQNAAMVGDNTVQIAALSQKAMVNTSTLEDCQKILEDTATKVKAFEEAGRQQRIADAAKRTELEQRMLAMVGR
jgi:uncharacterized protein YaaN involved in tellurite resistance